MFSICTLLLLVVFCVALVTLILAVIKPPQLPIHSALWLFLGCVFAAVAVLHFCP